MKRLTVDIKLHYSNSDQAADAEINTNNVPLTLVLESLNNIVKGLARQLVEGELTPEQAITKLTAPQPSVSPGVGGEVRQRLFPKPGIPHFRICFTRFTHTPYFQALNKEAHTAILKYCNEPHDL